MSQKNLNVLSKTHKLLNTNLENKKIFRLYKKFEKLLDIKENYTVAVSGGPDSLALAFLAKVYSVKKSINIKYLIVDHKLRKNSTHEARWVKKKLDKFSVNLKILTWNGRKPTNNIQSVARDKRYGLLIKESKKFKINNILLGHHLGDVFENFFIRILRGSGLNGIISLDKKTKNNQINFLRPLINFDKKDLIYISEYVFGSYIKDPSNKDDKFKRIKIRNLIHELEKEGLDKKKFLLTINNLKSANEAMKFYTKKNLEKNAFLKKSDKSLILKKDFFEQSYEIIFRSFSEAIRIVGKKYYPVRGKKLDRIISDILNNSFIKTTLGNCIIKKVSRTVIISKEC
mgnify:CR=1 FL=1